MDSEKYKEYTVKHANKSPSIKNCIIAFTVGGGICVLGEFIFNMISMLDISESIASILTSVILIFLSCLFTGFGSYDRLAKYAGAGTLVPITGFANAVCSTAIDNKAEGYIFGLSAKMFVIAGPVIVYGIISSVILGIVFYVLKIFGIDITSFILGA